MRRPINRRRDTSFLQGGWGPSPVDNSGSGDWTKNVIMHEERALATLSHPSTDEMQHMAGHADPRTTRLCHCRQKNVMRNIVEDVYMI